MEGSYFIISSLFLLSTAVAASQPSNFILTSCNSTTYPSLCIQTLSAYSPIIRHNPHKLAHTALSLSAIRASQTSSYVSVLSQSKKVGPYPQRTQSSSLSGVQDCMMTMLDSANQLQKAVRELKRLGRGAGRLSYRLRLGNVQTWVSAALTDQTMCLVGLVGSGEKDDVVVGIRMKVVVVSRATSIALSLLNQLTSMN